MGRSIEDQRAANKDYMRHRAQERRAGGLCADCGEPLAVLDPVSGKKVCSALCPGSGTWAVRIAYASCVRCRGLFIVRKSGDRATRCPGQACRRKTAKLARERLTTPNAQYMQDRREKRLAEGLCPQCGAPLEELGGKVICSAPCRAPLRATLIAYATCLFCRDLFVSRSRGKVSSLCRKPECQRAMGKVRNDRYTPSEAAKAKVKATSRARTHAKRTTVSDITPEMELAMRRKAKDCPLCGVRMTGEPRLPNSKELDHIVPLGVGGTHTIGNARIICRRCNRHRPHDGSDFEGQLTLWAQVPAPVSRPRRPGGHRNGTTCRKGLHPWPASAVTLWGLKQCGPCLEANRGAGYISRIGTRRKQVRGEAARLETGRQIQEMRRQGMPFRAIAAELGYRDAKPVREMLRLTGSQTVTSKMER